MQSLSDGFQSKFSIVDCVHQDIDNDDIFEIQYCTPKVKAKSRDTILISFENDTSKNKRNFVIAKNGTQVGMELWAYDKTELEKLFDTHEKLKKKVKA